MELQEECKKLRTDIATYQTKFHTVSHLLRVSDSHLKRAKDEYIAQETGNPISKTLRSYADHLHKYSRAMKIETNELREKRRSLGHESDTNPKQLEAFQSLKRLLQVKAQCQKAAQIQKEKEQKRNQMESHIEGEMIDFTKHV